MKRFLSAILTLCMMISMVPSAALPADATESTEIVTTESTTEVQQETTVATQALTETIPTEEIVEQQTTISAEETQESTVPVEDAQEDTEVSVWEYEICADGIILTAYTGTATDVYVPSTVDDHTVIKLGDGLFRDNDALNSVTLGAGILEIGEQTFYDCDQLVCVLISEELTGIGTQAFYSCDHFNSIIIYDSVIEIGENAFDDCPELTVWCNDGNAGHNYAQENELSFTLMSSDAEPEIHTLDGVSYYIMNGEAVAKDFDGSVTQLVMPATVEGYPVTELYYTFQDCTTLESVVLPSSIQAISDYAFSGCSALTQIEIPDSVVSIGNYGFQNCTALKSASLSENVLAIPEGIFSGCSALQTVDFSDSLQTVGQEAFYNCVALTGIQIPDTVTAFGIRSFCNCDSITQINIPQGITELPLAVFYGCDLLTQVTIPDSVTKIGVAAFRSSGLTEITLPNSVTSMGELVFADCKSLTKCRLPVGINTITRYMFSKCSALEEFVIADHITTIGYAAFQECTALKSLEVQHDLTLIDDYAFKNCDSLISVSFGADVATIDHYAFESCDALQTVTGSGTISELYSYVFKGCVALKNVDISAVYIANYTFTECTALETVTLHDSTRLNQATFSGCTSLKTLILPETLTYLGAGICNGCTNLEQLVLPEGLQSIGYNAFGSCNKLKSVVIPSTVTTLDTKGKSFHSDTILLVYKDSASHTLAENNHWLYMLYDGSQEPSYCIQDGITYSLLNGVAYALSCDTGLTSAVIPETVNGCTVTKLWKTFYNCMSLQTVTLPDTLTDIGQYAFYKCTALQQVEIPQSVTNIGQYAFYNCTALQQVQMSQSVTNIGEYAFYSCSALTQIHIPDKVKIIGNSAFKGCKILESVVIPESVEYLGGSAFENCYALKQAVILAPLTQMNGLTFSDCQLESFTIPDTVTTLGREEFSGCSKMVYIIVPESVTTIPTKAISTNSVLVVKEGSYAHTFAINNGLNYYLWDGVSELEIYCVDGVTYTIQNGEAIAVACDKSLTSVVIPQTVGGHPVTQLNRTFESCSNLVSVNLPEGLQVIGASTFYFCKKLSSCNFPSTLTQIGDSAFRQCNALTSVDIPESVTQIGPYAFSASGLISVTFHEGLKKIGNNAFSSTPLGEAILPEGLEYLGQNAFISCSGLKTVYVPSTVTTFGAGAFTNCTALTSVTLAPGLKTIGTLAFHQCWYLTEITIPGSVETVADRAFFNCTRLQKVILEEGVVNIDYSAFWQCYSLTSVSFPDSLRSIGNQAFYECSALESVTLNQGLTCIDERGFSACINLKQIVIPDTVQVIGTVAFEDCTSLKSVIFQGGEVMLYREVFGGCSKLTDVQLQGVTGISERCFKNCTSLVDVCIPNSAAIIGVEAFNGCTNLKNVTIMDGVTTIQNNAFRNCAAIENISIPGSVTTVENNAFVNCTGIRHIALEEGLNTIGTTVFSDSAVDMVFVPESVTSMAATSFSVNAVLLVYENSYAHNFAKDNYLLYFVIPKTQNPQIHYGTNISGIVSYTDASAASGATVEILYDDGTVKETVTTDETGAYAFTYAEVGQYTIRVTDVSGNSASTQVSVKRMNVFDVFLAGDTNLTLKKGWTVSGTVASVAATVTITDEVGNVLDIVETADGSFAFDNIPNGSYVVKAETENGTVTQEITVFDGAVSDIVLTAVSDIVTIWGYVEVEDREYNHHRRNWVQVSIYNAEGIVVAQTKSDSEGLYRFEKLPIGQYSIVAETAEMRPDKKHSYDRSHTLTGYAYVDASTAGEYQADTIVLYEENDSLATISGKVTAQGESQACQVVLRNVFRHQVAQQTTGKNGKYSFTNVRDGLYFITAVTEGEGMGYTVVAVRNGKVHGETDITVYKVDKIKDREDRFYQDFDSCHDRDTALKHKDRIVEEKRFYDGLSEKEKKQLSREYVDRLNRMCEWIAECEYVTDEGVTVEQGGLVISGDELENEDTVTFEINVEKTDAWTANTEGVKEDKDFIYHDMHDKAGKGQIKQYYEISMTKTVDGQSKQITSVTKDTDSTGKFRITMEIPEEYRGHKHYTMLHVHNGETVTLADLDDDPNTITFEVDGFSTFALTGTDEILVPVANAEVWQDAQLYGNYTTLEEAVTAYDSATQYVKLTQDASVTLELMQDLYIDLSGYTLTGTIITNGYKIYGMDSATNSYTSDTMGYFNCTDAEGNTIVPEKLVKTTAEMTENVLRYMTIETENGYTFHRFYLGITYTSLKPSVTGVGYKAVFYGDTMVAAELDAEQAFGYTMQLGDFNSISVYKPAESFVSGKTVTLRINNYDVQNFGETPLHASVTMKLADGTVIESAQYTVTLRQLVESVNENYTSYTAEQIAAVTNMIEKNLIMQTWNVGNLFTKES